MRKLSMSREEFKAAFREVISSEFAQIPTDEDSIDFTFSEKFIKRMDKLIRAQKKSYYKFINTAGKRVAVIFAAIITLFTASLSVKAIREPVVRFIKQIYETFTHYTFEGDTVDVITKEFNLNIVPDGFIETDRIANEISITKIYENNSGNSFELVQTITDDTEATFDTENAKKYEIIVTGITVDLYESEYIKTALWTKDGYMFNLTCYGDITLDTIETIISNIK